MNNYLKMFFMISFFLFTFIFISDGMAQEVLSENRSECSDYIMDVYPAYSFEGSNENLVVDIHYYVREVVGRDEIVVADTMDLGLVFSLRQRNSTQTSIQVSGVGDLRDFRRYVTSRGDIDLNDTPGYPDPPNKRSMFRDVIREAVTSAYERLGDTQLCFQEVTIDRVSSRIVVRFLIQNREVSRTDIAFDLRELLVEEGLNSDLQMTSITQATF